MTAEKAPTASHRRGRRHETTSPRKGDLRESSILAGFEELLQRQPYVELNMDDLARAAGMSRPALYFYFSSKEEVLVTLFERRHLQVMQLVIEPGGTLPPAERVRSMLGAYLATWSAHSAVFVTFFEVGMTSAVFGERWRANLGESVPAIVALIDSPQPASATSPTAEELAWALIWATQHNIYEVFRHKHSADEERRLHQTLCYLWLRTFSQLI